MSKHTKGPWTFRPEEPLVESCDEETGFIRMVADCSKSFTLTDDEMKANAQLISAAPDMLSALQHAYEMLVSARVEVYNHDRANYERCEKVINLCWAVLHKATITA